MLPYMTLQEANINNFLACQICQEWKSQIYCNYWEKESKNYV